MQTTEPQDATLDAAMLERSDPSGLLADVLALPEQLRDALWKAESAGLEPRDSPAG